MIGALRRVQVLGPETGNTKRKSGPIWQKWGLFIRSILHTPAARPSDSQAGGRERE